MHITALKLIIAVLFVAVVANVAFLNYKILGKQGQSSQISNESNLTPINLSDNATEIITKECGLECLKLIEASISAVNKKIDQIQSSIPKTTSQTTATTSQTQPKVGYLNFGVNGSTISTNWTDLAGSDFIFDAANFPGAKAFYFEANLTSDATDRDTFARIFDVTHSVGVQGSDLKYRGLTSTFIESGSLTFLSGKLTLRVQIHSLNGNLATIDNPRIRIVY